MRALDCKLIKFHNIGICFSAFLWPRHLARHVKVAECLDAATCRFLSRFLELCEDIWKWREKVLEVDASKSPVQIELPSIREHIIRLLIDCLDAIRKHK